VRPSRQIASDAWVFVLDTSGAAVTGDASVYAGSRMVSLAGQTLTDELSPREVHVHQLPRI